MPVKALLVQQGAALDLLLELVQGAAEGDVFQLLHGPPGFIIPGTLLIASLVNDVTYQLNSKEDWVAAAHALARAANDGYCLQMAGERGQTALYAVFVPDLRDRWCPLQANPPRVALVSNSYTKNEDLRSAVDQLRQSGFSIMRTLSVGGTTISLEERRVAD